MDESIFIGEQQFGLFEGLPRHILKSQYPQEYSHFEKSIASGGRFWVRPPLGESRFDVAMRVCRLIDDIKQEYFTAGTDRFIIVSHGVTIRAFLMMWFKHRHEV